MVIELHVRGGGLVARAEIPLMEPAPEVILWGSRIFAITREAQDRGGTPVYDEACAWTITGEFEINP